MPLAYTISASSQREVNKLSEKVHYVSHEVHLEEQISVVCKLSVFSN